MIVEPHAKAIEQACKLIIIGSLTYLWFSVIPLKFTISGLLILSSLILLGLVKWTQIKRKGFLNGISEKARKFLLERSLFDILCDIWYFETIKRHLRVFLGPFFIKKSPEEIIQSFDDINPQLKDAILRKGTINLLPEPIKQELAENYIQEGEPQEEKQIHQQYLEQRIEVQHWDRYADYEQYATRQKKKNSSQTLFHVVNLLMHKPIVHKQNHKNNLQKLSNKTQTILFTTIIVILTQLYFQRSSRLVYKKAFTTLSSMGLLTVATGSLMVMLLSKKKEKQI